MKQCLWVVDHFLRYGSLFARGHEEVDARTSRFQAVVDGVGLSAAVGHETVNQGAFHVVHFDLDVSAQVLEVECHLTVVRIRDDYKVNGF